ncbi:MAG: acetyltransferase [Planctomycetes bacterium]|nr:acetyltransferase [Planctomycetota bacterium]
MGTIIVGAGGHGRVVLDILRQAHHVDPVGFIDSNPVLRGREVDGLTVLGSLPDIPELRRRLSIDAAIVAIGDNATRDRYAKVLSSQGLRLVNAIHPKASVADTVRLGRNIVVAAGAVICAHCRVSDSCIINTASIVDHESFLGRAAHICPGARLAGRVIVEDLAFVGIGATVIQCVTIGRNSTVGAGAVVLRNVEPFTTVVGVPARRLESSEDKKLAAAVEAVAS